MCEGVKADSTMHLRIDNRKGTIQGVEREKGLTTVEVNDILDEPETGLSKCAIRLDVGRLGFPKIKGYKTSVEIGLRHALTQKDRSARLKNVDTLKPQGGAND